MRFDRVVLSASLLLIAGCSAPPRAASVVATLLEDDERAQLDFWHTLARRPLASSDDAMHALLLLADGRDSRRTYPDRVVEFKYRKALPADFAFSSLGDEAVERGTVAMLLANVLKVQGGLSMRLLGPSPRYAMREMEFLDLFPPGSPSQFLTGLELIGIIARAEDYQAGRDAAADLACGPAEIPAREGIAFRETEAPLCALADPVAISLHPLPELTIPFFAAETAPGSRTASVNAIVSRVEGPVQVRDHDQDGWRAPRVGEALRPGAEIRTGARAMIQYSVGGTQTFTHDHYGLYKYVSGDRQARTIRSDVRMEYGVTGVVVEPRALTIAATGPTGTRPADPYGMETVTTRNVTTITSPSGQLAVGGTRVVLFDQRPFPSRAVSLTGRATFTNLRRQAVVFGAAGRKTKVRGDKEDAAQLSLEGAVVDPTLVGARTESESALLANLVSRGATIFTDPATGIRIVQGGRPPTDAQLPSLLPGRLDFVLTWGGRANLDLGVVATGPAGELADVVYPAGGLDISPLGGKTAFDHRGGAHGGIEIVSWKNPPAGQYNFFARYVSGKTQSARVRVFLDGRPQMVGSTPFDINYTEVSDRVAPQQDLQGATVIVPTAPAKQLRSPAPRSQQPPRR